MNKDQMKNLVLSYFNGVDNEDFTTIKNTLSETCRLTVETHAVELNGHHEIKKMFKNLNKTIKYKSFYDSKIDDIKDFKGDKPKLKYLAQYITLIKYIQQLDVLPKVTLYSNKNVVCGDVDLVVDIGNSRTCAVLYDNADFTKTSPLELRDFTDPIINGEININFLRRIFQPLIIFYSLFEIELAYWLTDIFVKLT